MARFEAHPSSPGQPRPSGARPPAGASDAERREGRRGGRLRCSMLGSNHGEVMDISATGAKIALRRAPDLKAGDVFKLEVDSGAGLGSSLKLDCCVVWLRLNADKKFEMGVEFRDMTPELKKRLLEVVLHPTRTQALQRGWTLVPEPIDDGE